MQTRSRYECSQRLEPFPHKGRREGGQPHSSNVSIVRSEPLGLEGWSRSVRLLVLLEALDIWSHRRGDMPAIDGVLGRLCSEKNSCDYFHR